MEKGKPPGTRVLIRYAGARTSVVGKHGTTEVNDFDKYDYRVRVDGGGHPHVLYFFHDELEELTCPDSKEPSRPLSSTPTER